MLGVVYGVIMLCAVGLILEQARFLPDGYDGDSLPVSQENR